MKTAKARNRSRLILAGLLVAILATANAGAVEYVDVDQPIGIGGTATGLIEQQTFIPSADNITAVSFYLYVLSSSYTVTAKILDSVCGTVLAQGTGTGSGWVKCDLDTPIAVIPGNTYVIEISGVGGVPFSLDVGGNPYADGEFYRSCAVFNNGDGDLVFKTWAESDPVSTVDSSWSAVKALFR